MINGGIAYLCYNAGGGTQPPPESTDYAINQSDFLFKSDNVIDLNLTDSNFASLYSNGKVVQFREGGQVIARVLTSGLSLGKLTITHIISSGGDIKNYAPGTLQIEVE